MNWVERVVSATGLRREVIHFLFWGVMNTLVMYSLFAIFQIFLPYAIAYTIAYSFGILFSYYVNSRFVFHGKMTMQKLVSYPLVYVIQYLIGLVSLAVFIDLLFFPRLLALPLSTVVSIPVTFILARYIIKDRNED